MSIKISLKKNISEKNIKNLAINNCNNLTTIYAYDNTINAMGWTNTNPQTIGGISVDIINLSTTVFTYTDNSTSTTEDTILTYNSYDDVNKTLLKINIGTSVTQIGDSISGKPFFSNIDKAVSLKSLTLLKVLRREKLIFHPQKLILS